MARRRKKQGKWDWIYESTFWHLQKAQGLTLNLFFNKWIFLQISKIHWNQLLKKKPSHGLSGSAFDIVSGFFCSFIFHFFFFHSFLIFFINPLLLSLTKEEVFPWIIQSRYYLKLGLNGDSCILQTFS